MKKTLLSFLLLFSAMLSYGAEFVFDCTDPVSLGYTKPAKGSATNIDKDLKSGEIKIDVVSGSTETRFWGVDVDKIEMRAYKPGSFTFSTTNGESITEIILQGDAVGSTLFENPPTGKFTTATKQITWSGNATSIKLTLKGTVKISTIKVKTEALSSIEAPSFNILDGVYYENKNVTITSETTDSKIYYTINGDEPTSSSTLYSNPIEVTSSMTIKAIAIKGEEKSAVSLANYIIGSIVSSLPEWNQTAVETYSKINTALTAVYQNGQYLYLTDNADNYILSYGNVGKTYSNGDIIPAGIKGQKVDFNDLIELVPDASSFGDATNGALVSSNVFDINDITVAHQNKFIKIKEVSIDATKKELVNGDKSISYFIKFGNTAPTDNKKYDVEGFVAVYNGKVQIYPSSFVVSTSLENTLSESITITSNNGLIEVVGEASDIEVYSMSGSLISKNAVKTACPNGVYIVKVDGKASKVVVK